MKIQRIAAIVVVLSATLSACSRLELQKQGRQATASAIAQSTIRAAASAGATDVPACTTAGSLTQMQIDSAELGEKLTFSVYLPPCYDTKKTGGYPVLYLLHGQNMDDTYWPSLGITDLANEKILGGAPAFIMVFPYEVHNWDPVSGSKFGDAVTEDLIPYVESHFAACTERSCRAIGGLSRGGGWALHIGLTHFEEFGAIGAHSPGYFSGDLYRVENLLQVYSTEDFPRMYFDRGEEDYLKDSIDQYVANLDYTGVAYEYHVNPGSHETAYWQSQVQNYLDWYIEGFSTPR